MKNDYLFSTHEKLGVTPPYNWALKTHVISSLSFPKKKIHHRAPLGILCHYWTRRSRRIRIYWHTKVSDMIRLQKQCQKMTSQSKRLADAVIIKKVSRCCQTQKASRCCQTQKSTRCCQTQKSPNLKSIQKHFHYSMQKKVRIPQPCGFICKMNEPPY